MSLRCTNHFLRKVRLKRNILIFLFATSLLFACDSVKDIEIKNIETLKKLSEKNVDSIEILKKDKLVKRISNAQGIKNFTDSLIDLTKFHPNHPSYMEKWYVRIKLANGSDEELYLMKEKNDQKNLYVNPLGHRWLGGGGTARSKLLYKWIINNNLD